MDIKKLKGNELTPAEDLFLKGATAALTVATVYMVYDAGTKINRECPPQDYNHQEINRKAE